MSEFNYNRIKAVLAEKDMQHDEFAAKVGVTPQTVSSWLNNRTQPTIERFHEIAAILGVDVFSLLLNPPVPKQGKRNLRKANG